MRRLVFNIAKAIPSYLQPQVKVRRDGHTQRYWVLPPGATPDPNEVGVLLADDKTLGLLISYDPDLVSRIKALPNRRWHPYRKIWKVPLADYPLVEKKLKHLALTEKALAALEAAGLVSVEPPAPPPAPPPPPPPPPPKPERKGELVPIFERGAETKAARKRGVMAQVRKEYGKLLKVATANDVTHVAVIRSPHHADLSRFRLGRGDAVLAEIEIRDGVAQTIRGSDALSQEAEKALTGARSVVPVYGSPVMLMPTTGPTPKWGRPAKVAPTKPIGPLTELFERLAPVQPVVTPTPEKKVEVAPTEDATRAARRAASDAKYAKTELRRLALDVQGHYAGEKPEGQHVPEGERVNVGGGERADGSGEWFVIGKDHIWYIRNNGRDGDNWGENNVLTGGAGAIGWRVPYHRDMADDIRYHASLQEPVPVEQPPAAPAVQPPVEPVDAAADAEALEMVEKYRISLAPEQGPDVLRVGKKPSAKELEVIRAAKPAILRALRERERREKEASRARAEERERQKQLDEPLILEAQAEAQAMIPEGGVKVNVRKTGTLDGDPIYEYTLDDGTRVNWADVTTVGVVTATRPGETEPFHRERAAYITAERLAELDAERAAREADRQAKEAGREAKRRLAFSQARETGQPVAIRSWTEPCDGSVAECSLDQVTEIAQPDGSTRTKRVHTH